MKCVNNHLMAKLKLRNFNSFFKFPIMINAKLMKFIDKDMSLYIPY